MVEHLQDFIAKVTSGRKRRYASPYSYRRRSGPDRKTFLKWTAAAGLAGVGIAARNFLDSQSSSPVAAPTQMPTEAPTGTPTAGAAATSEATPSAPPATATSQPIERPIEGDESMSATYIDGKPTELHLGGGRTVHVDSVNFEKALDSAKQSGEWESAFEYDLDAENASPFPTHTPEPPPNPEKIETDPLSKGVEVIQSDRVRLTIQKSAFEKSGLLEYANLAHNDKDFSGTIHIVLVDAPVVTREAMKGTQYDSCRDLIPALSQTPEEFRAQNMAKNSQEIDALKAKLAATTDPAIRAQIRGKIFDLRGKHEIYAFMPDQNILSFTGQKRYLANCIEEDKKIDGKYHSDRYIFLAVGKSPPQPNKIKVVVDEKGTFRVVHAKRAYEGIDRTPQSVTELDDSQLNRLLWDPTRRIPYEIIGNVHYEQTETPSILMLYAMLFRALPWIQGHLEAFRNNRGESRMVNVDIVNLQTRGITENGNDAFAYISQLLNDWRKTGAKNFPFVFTDSSGRTKMTRREFLKSLTGNHSG